MALTLKDIAKMVGVAESTVSRAINNKAGVGEDTRKKILEIVEKYNYKPNQMAQGLAKQETRIIALFVPDLSIHSHLQIMKKVEEVANNAGYQVILCNTRESSEREKAYLNLLEKNQVDGAIIVGSKLTDENIINTALRGDNIIVLINRLTEEILLPTVLIDKARGAYLATEHLIKQGFEKIAIIMGNTTNYTESEKLAGYKDALADYGLEYDESYVFSSSGEKKDGHNAFMKAIDLTYIPRAFFVTNELMAAGLVESIKMGGYLIPEDFATVCYGESILTSVIEPSLTVIAEPLEEMGSIASEYLIQLIKGNSPSEIIKVLKPELKINDSSTPQIINE